MIQHYLVKGMHCSSCVGKIEAALRRHPEIESVSVTLNPPRARVSAESAIVLSSLNTELAALGDYSFEPVAANDSDASAATGAQPPESLRPLYVIVAYLLAGVFLRATISGDYSASVLMANFMGAFFVMFSLFKMIDLSGFAEGYATYDLLAMRSRTYAYVYPFIELGLGVSYFVGAFPVATNTFTAALMGFGALGVWRTLRAGRKIQCACLGTALKLPMTKVTLVEDLGMGGMALLMLLAHLR